MSRSQPTQERQDEPTRALTEPRDGAADSLGMLRDQVEAVSHEIVRLLNQRLELVLRIGEEKSSRGLPLSDPGREREVLLRLARESQGPLASESLQRIFHEIFATSVAAMERSLAGPDDESFQATELPAGPGYERDARRRREPWSRQA